MPASSDKPYVAAAGGRTRQRLIGGGAFPLPAPSAIPMPPEAGFLPAPTYSLIRLVNARSAFWLLAKSTGTLRVWLPSYICQSVVDGFAAANTQVLFYAVCEQLRCVNDAWLAQVRPDDVVLRVHYFGFKNDDPVVQAATARGARIVDDAAQALLSDDIGADAQVLVFSPRKFVGVPDGGYLAYLNGALHITQPAEVPPDAWWRTSLAAVVGRRDFEAGSESRAWHTNFQEAERAAPIGAFAMSSLSRVLLEGAIDYDAIRVQRRKNFAVLLEMLAEHAMFHRLPGSTVPLGFPVRLAHRDSVRRSLFAQQIFPAVHWLLPATLPDGHEESRRLSESILTLPSDQRYDEDDMRRVAHALLEAVDQQRPIASIGAEFAPSASPSELGSGHGAAAGATRRNVLVTCGGKWVGIVRQIREAMNSLPEFRMAKIVVVSVEPLTPAGCFADVSVQVPLIRDPAYVDCLLEVCRQHEVGVVIPLIDLDLDRLAPHLARFATEGTVIACPEPVMVQLCLDKFAFFEFARANNLAHPATVDATNLADLAFPAYYKRRHGFGSIGSGICATREEAETFAAAQPDLLFQELVCAPELTIDVFIARDGRTVARVPRFRDKVVAGEVFKSHTARVPAAEELADRTVAALAALGLRGALNVQLFLGPEPSLIEVNTRLGSGVVLSNVATEGRILRSLLVEAAGGTATGSADDFRAGLHLSRFWGDVFHDGEAVIAVHPQ